MSSDPIFLRATDDTLLYVNINRYVSSSVNDTRVRKGDIVLYLEPVSDREALYLHAGIIHLDLDLIHLRYSVFEEF